MTTPGAARSGLTTLEYLAIGSVLVALAFAFLTPPEVTQGQVARLFYLHLPSIGAAYLAFFASLVASVFYLVTKRRAWDSLAVAAAEVGVVFTFFTILVGMIWAKPTWGVYWTWSPRLTLTAIMLFVYIGYLALRRAIQEPRARARTSAIYASLAIVQVPIVHFSVSWWADIHQTATLVRPDGMQMDGILFAAFAAGMVAAILGSIALVWRRYELAEMEAVIESVAVAGEGVLAGDAVDAPRLAGEPG
jgi:heme exporter protein C